MNRASEVKFLGIGDQEAEDVREEGRLQGEPDVRTEGLHGSTSLIRVASEHAYAKALLRSAIGVDPLASM